MNKNDQLSRVNAFIERISLPTNPEGLILLDSEMESYGAQDARGTDWQNGGDCSNGGIGTCASNKQNCYNSSLGCINSKNGGNCKNDIPLVVGSNCQKPCN